MTMHNVSEIWGWTHKRNSETNRMSGTEKNKMCSFVSVYLLSVWLGFLCVMFVCLWSGTWRGGFSWDGSFLQFNWHPVLMVSSLVVLYGNAIVLYRVPLSWSRRWCKLAHGGLLFAALLLSVLGVCAAFDFHRAYNIPHLYSLHSWTGISTVALFTLQWVVGFCAFLLPWSPSTFRARIKPLHIWMGTSIFILSLISSLSGINEKLLLTLNGRNGSNTEPYTALPAEALFANSLGVLVVGFGLVVLNILYNQKWKKPEFENGTDRPLLTDAR